MSHFRRFFEIFWETLLTIFPIFSLKTALSSAFQTAKTVCQNKFLFLRYLRSKLDHSIGAFEVFREYLANAGNDFAHFRTKCSPQQCLSPCENRQSKLFFVLEILEVKVGSFSRCDLCFSRLSRKRSYRFCPCLP